MKTAIVCNGSIKDYDFTRNVLQSCDCIICADGGMRHTYNMNVIPDIVIGDLDSAAIQLIEYYRCQNVEFIEYSSDKNETDAQLCLEYALNFSEEILILGALGSRIDHTIANVSLLRLGLDKNITIKLIDEKNEIRMINKEITLHGKKGDIVSLLPMSESVTGVNITGVHYELKDAVMEIGNPYGISNLFEEELVHINIAAGYLLVIKSFD